MMLRQPQPQPMSATPVWKWSTWPARAPRTPSGGLAGRGCQHCRAAALWAAHVHAPGGDPGRVRHQGAVVPVAPQRAARNSAVSSRACCALRSAGCAAQTCAQVRHDGGMRQVPEARCGGPAPGRARERTAQRRAVQPRLRAQRVAQQPHDAPVHVQERGGLLLGKDDAGDGVDGADRSPGAGARARRRLLADHRLSRAAQGHSS